MSDNMEDLNYIRNKAWCSGTVERARSRWNKIKDSISPEIYRDYIDCSLFYIGYPDETGYEKNDLREAIKCYIEKNENLAMEYLNHYVKINGSWSFRCDNPDLYCNTPDFYYYEDYYQLRKDNK